MGRVEEIEQTIDRLPSDEFFRLARWLREREQQRWDEQLDRDSSCGKLDLLFEEADAEREKGPLRDFPPST